MRYHRIVNRIAVLAMTLAFVVTASPLHADERAETLIERMNDFYRSHDSLSHEARLYSRQKVGQREQISDLHFSATIERPNRLALDFRDAQAGDEPQATIRSDGEELIAYDAAENRYLTTAAPDTLDALAESQSLLAVTQGALEIAVSPMTERPFSSLLEDAQDVTHAGEEEIDGVSYEVIRADLDDGVYVDVYVASGDEPYVRRVEVDASEQAESFAQQTGQDVELEMFVAFENWQADVEPAAERFAFAPPEDATEVDTFVPQQAQQEGHPLEGEEAPDFQLERFGGGERDLASHEGEDIVILDFWATWCGPCVRAMPMIIEVAEEYADRNVVFYAVNLRESEEQIEAFLEQHGMEIENVLLDRQGEVGNSYQARSIPQTVIVGKDGVVHSVHVGFSPDLKQALSAEIDQMLEEE